MRVKRYVVRSVPDAMARIRQDLGDNAVILDSKPITEGGFLGLFGRKRFEVIAAIDVNKPTGIRPPARERTSVTPTSDDSLRREVQSLKQLMLNWMNEQTNEPSPVISYVERLLQDQDVHPEIIQSLATTVTESVQDVSTIDEKRVTQIVKNEITNTFERAIELPRIGQGKRKLVYFVGPTGVGKTTTIAKIAARYVLDEGKKVGLITADTYRIAAVDQLRTYANILNVPIEIVHDPQDVPAVKEKLSGCDVILFDTAGRNFRQKMNVSELFSYIQSEEAAAIHLVISMTMRAHDVQALLQNFASSPITHVLLTKTDETSSFGLALNLAWQTPYKLAFLTTGQNVPDDIVEANAAQLASWTLGDGRHD